MANLGFKAGFLKHLYIQLHLCLSLGFLPVPQFQCLPADGSTARASGPVLLGGEMLLYIGGDALWLAWHHSGALFLPQEDPTGG